MLKPPACYASDPVWYQDRQVSLCFTHKPATNAEPLPEVNLLTGRCAAGERAFQRYADELRRVEHEAGFCRFNAWVTPGGPHPWSACPNNPARVELVDRKTVELIRRFRTSSNARLVGLALKVASE